MPYSPHTLLSIENMSVSFKNKENSVRVLKDFSLTLPYNHILGIVGESGSGKSISMLALLGLLPDHAQRNVQAIHWKKNDISILNATQLRQYRGKDFAYIYQEPSQAYDPLYNIYKTFRESYRAHQATIDEESIYKNATLLLQEMGIQHVEERLYSYFYQFSGGMIQRVQIALSLIHNPKLLIADEITTALDITTQKKIIELLLQVKQQHNMSIIFISHDIALVASIADSMIVMNNGNIVEQGSVEQVLYNAKHSYTKQLVSTTINFGDRRSIKQQQEKT